MTDRITYLAADRAAGVVPDCDLCGDPDPGDVVVLDPENGEDVQLCGRCVAAAALAIGKGRHGRSES